MSRRISSRVVPRATTERACVWPRVNSAEPCVRGATLVSIVIGRISSRGAPVGALLVDGDPLADRGLLEPVEGHLRGGLALGVAVGLRVAGVLLEDLGLDGLGRVLALELVLDLGGRVELRAVRGLDLGEQLLVDLRDLDLLLGLADLLGQLALQGAELLDLAVGDVERVEDLGLGHLVGAGLDHEDRVVGAGHDQVEVGVALEEVLLGRVDDERCPRSCRCARRRPGSATGTSEIISAAEAPFIARTS